MTPKPSDTARKPKGKILVQDARTGKTEEIGSPGKRSKETLKKVGRAHHEALERLARR